MAAGAHAARQQPDPEHRRQDDRLSWVLAELGITSLALGFAAGLTGEVSAQLLRDQGVTVDYITVGGESRRNLVIADQAATITPPSPSIR